jgi:hypothetical protein
MIELVPSTLKFDQRFLLVELIPAGRLIILANGLQAESGRCKAVEKICRRQTMNYCTSMRK